MTNKTKYISSVTIVIIGIVIYIFSSETSVLRIVGITIFCAGIVTSIKILISYILNHYTIGIFHLPKNGKDSKFQKEDKKCLKLRHVSFSAGKLLEQLTSDQSSLYSAFRKRKAKLQILIVDPSSNVADQRAREERPGDPQLSKGRMKESFSRIKEVWEKLNNQYQADQWGELVIMLTKENPIISLNIYDEKKLFLVS